MFAVLCNVCLIGCLVGYLLSSHPEWRTVYTPFSPVIMLPFTGFLGCLNCYLVGYGEWSDPQLGVKSRDAFKVSILSVSTGVAAVKAIQYAVEYVRGD